MMMVIIMMMMIIIVIIIIIIIIIAIMTDIQCFIILTVSFLMIVKSSGRLPRICY